MYRWQLDESDFAHLRNYRQRIRRTLKAIHPFNSSYISMPPFDSTGALS